MWQLNADDFFGAVPTGSHGPPEKAHEKIRCLARGPGAGKF